MNKNVLIALGGATLIALLVAMLMSALLGGGEKESKDTAVATPRVQIAVASSNIGAGQLLTDENVKWKSWPEDAVFPGVVVKKGDEKVTEAISGRLIRPVQMDEPIPDSAVVSDEAGFMAARLEEGKRAIAVKVSAQSMAGGFINPGDYVDVILTYRLNVSARSNDPVLQQEMTNVIDRNIDRYVSETVLQNVKVLGVDQKSFKDDENAAKVGKTATLEVDQRGAEILALVSQMGDITLSLRPLGDEKPIPEQETVSDARLTKMKKEIYGELDEVVKTSGAQRHNVRIYNGGTVTNLPTR